MQLLERMWNRIIEATAETNPEPEKGAAPEMEPPRNIEPHGTKEDAGDAAHTWKSHGGFRH